MSIISQETWDNMPEEEKEKIRIDYHNYNVLLDTKSMAVLENIFGKENLQPKPKIRTWEDVVKKNPNYECDVRNNFPKCVDEKLKNKLIATYKIAKLIELGYGGMVTEEEWKDGTEKWFIALDSDAKPQICVTSYNYREFIAFHNEQQAEEFMRHYENVELVKQYYML